MPLLDHLFQNNRAWAESMETRRPGFFASLAWQQSPRYLWIGCADSRVPANEIVGLAPGELFVHRNVANLVIPTDFNCLAVLQYAVEVLRVEHIIVCGHYGCGGVQAALEDQSLGLIDNWIRHVRNVAAKHSQQIAALASTREKGDRLCELNVVEQALQVCEGTVVSSAWARGQPISVHAWIYRVDDGLLRDLGFAVSRRHEVQDAFQRATENRPAS
jgi:carbonic anhydrase